MNEHEIYAHANKNSGIQIVQLEFTTWKYKVKLSATECSIKKDVRKTFAIFTGKHLCWSLFLLKLKALRSSEHLF